MTTPSSRKVKIHAAFDSCHQVSRQGHDEIIPFDVEDNLPKVNVNSKVSSANPR